jgi:hypothetical protein
MSIDLVRVVPMLPQLADTRRFAEDLVVALSDMSDERPHAFAELPALLREGRFGPALLRLTDTLCERAVPVAVLDGGPPLARIVVDGADLDLLRECSALLGGVSRTLHLDRLAARVLEWHMQDYHSTIHKGLSHLDRLLAIADPPLAEETRVLAARLETGSTDELTAGEVEAYRKVVDFAGARLT